MQTQHGNRVSLFLTQSLKYLIDTQAISDVDFCSIADPQILGAKLAPHSDQRGYVLHAAIGMKQTIGSKQSPETTSSLLRDAFADFEDEPDPSKRIATRVRSAVAFEKWVEILGPETTWSILFSSKWHKLDNDATAEIALQLLQFAEANGILNSAQIVTSISPTCLGEQLPEALVRSLVISIGTDILAGRTPSPDDIRNLVDNTVLLKTFGTNFVVEHVLCDMAKRLGLVKAKTAQFNLAAATATPPEPASSPNGSPDPVADTATASEQEPAPYQA